MTAGSSVPEAARAADAQAEHFKVCGCHDSWDQCPCADSGHPADGSCDCCPLGTGICGPWPATARADAIAAYWEHPQANSIGLRGNAIWAAVQAALPALVAAAVAEERAAGGALLLNLADEIETLGTDNGKDYAHPYARAGYQAAADYVRSRRIDRENAKQEGTT